MQVIEDRSVVLLVEPLERDWVTRSRTRNQISIVDHPAVLHCPRVVSARCPRDSLTHCGWRILLGD
jgi:hypothetical protein